MLDKLDYAFLSPIFDSISKQGYSAAFDLSFLETAIANAKCPILALGGEELLWLVVLLRRYNTGVKKRDVQASSPTRSSELPP